MKKIIVILIFLFLIYSVYSQQQIGFFPIGADINIAEDKTISPSINLNFGYFSIEWLFFTDNIFYLWDFDLPIGIIWTPVNYRYMLNEHYWSFINFQIYWNILDLIKADNPYDLSWQNSMFIGGAIFGPFASINYALNFDRDNYIFCAGIRYNITGKDHGNRFYIFNIELGYRLFNDGKNLYFGINFDIVTDTFLLLFHLDQKKRKKEKVKTGT